MINNELFKKAVEESGISIPRLSALTEIPQEKILSLMEDGDTVNTREIQVLANELGMSDAMRRNTFFNRNLPMD